MVISIASGKGGPGKTVITGAFAALAENKVMVDCDIDAADLHLLLDPKIEEAHYPGPGGIEGGASSWGSLPHPELV